MYSDWQKFCCKLNLERQLGVSRIVYFCLFFFFFSTNDPNQTTRAEGVFLFANWHYIDMPFVIDANLTAPDVLEPNSVWALQQCTRGLQSRALSPWAASFYLRWIVHLMGDIHQPLHNIAQFSRDLALDEGDRGGNECKLNAIASNITSDITNLHSFWDSAGGLRTLLSFKLFIIYYFFFLI